MNNILLQIDSSTLSGATPFSTAIYSVLVIILMAAIGGLVKFTNSLMTKHKAELAEKDLEIKECRKENKELTEKALLLIGEIKEKVLDHAELIKDIGEIKRRTQDIEDYIKKH